MNRDEAYKKYLEAKRNEEDLQQDIQKLKQIYGEEERLSIILLETECNVYHGERRAYEYIWGFSRKR